MDGVFTSWQVTFDATSLTATYKINEKYKVVCDIKNSIVSVLKDGVAVNNYRYEDPYTAEDHFVLLAGLATHLEKFGDIA
jgi:hypothetical protein